MLNKNYLILFFLITIINMNKALKGNCISSIERLSFPAKTPDPFLFCVYHKDAYPADKSGKMEAPRKGNGQDFDPNIPWRMYHGDKFPGFPQHPHRGFETLTATIDGHVDHTDSEGNAGRYGNGDNQWMTAGKGIVHGENFPLIYEKKPNHTRFFQIWLNLPSKDKMVDPDFVMHWAENIKKIVSEDKLVSTTVFAGDIDGVKGLPPPKNSWANNINNEVTVLHITIKPGGVFTLPAAIGGKEINRMAYWIEGNKLSVNGDILKDNCAITLDASMSVSFSNTNIESYTSESKKVSPLVSEVLILQGRPIKEPVVQHGPFVMNTDQEIQQAFADYRRTQFGGWPWPDDSPVFPRFKGRFALKKGIEERPPNFVPITSEEGDEILEDLEPLLKDPSLMSIKELKVCINQAGLIDKCRGCSEKQDFVQVLLNHYKKNEL